MTIHYKIITSIAELPEFDPAYPIFADIESGDLYIEPRLIQLLQTHDKPYGEDNPVIILDLAPKMADIPTLDTRVDELREWMKSYWFVWYNGSYDLGTLNVVPAKTDDLFYAVKTAYPHFMEFSLDKVTLKLRETYHLYKDLDKGEMHKRGFKPGAYLSKKMYVYSATDIVALDIMWKDKRIQDVIQNNLAYKVDILSLNYCVQYQQNGLKVPQDIVQEEMRKAEEDIEVLAIHLPPTLNVNSSPQVKLYLGTEGASREVLLRCENPKAKVILKLKKRKKELSYLKSIDYDTMVTKFNPAGAITGRFTAKGGAIPNGFNAQQIPHRFQYIFKQPIDGTKVVGLDYATLELRVAACLWGIKQMREFFINEKDLHTEMALNTTGKRLHEDGIIEINDDQWGQHISDDYITNEDRTHAKALNFGFVFGMSAKSFIDYAFNAYGVMFTIQEAAELRKKFFDLYPEAAAWHEYVWSNYKKPTFYVETALGRRVKPRMGTDGINIPVQGTGAEATKLAVHYLIKEYPESIDYIFNCVHDAIYLRVPEDEYDLWGERLSTAMVKGWDEIKKTAAFKYKDITMKVAV